MPAWRLKDVSRGNHISYGGLLPITQRMVGRPPELKRGRTDIALNVLGVLVGVLFLACLAFIP